MTEYVRVTQSSLMRCYQNLRRVQNRDGAVLQGDPEIQAHVLLGCPWYRRWWNCQGEFEFLQRVSAYRDITTFLTANESAFTFADALD